MIISVLIVVCSYCVSSFAQPLAQKDTSQNIVSNITEGRPLKKWMVSGIHIIGAGVSLYTFYTKWYRDYPSQPFYTVNDMHHWRMMDKCGHAWSAYTLARLSASLWEQTGMEHHQAVHRAGMAAMGYQTLIELMDGFSSKWGFSWGDMGADLLGTMAYMLQQSYLKNQIVSLKFMSFKKVKYSADIHDRANELFGHAFASQLLSDYNTQTYWASINIKAVFPRTKLPSWINIGIGYGARQMLGETCNQWIDKNNVLFNRSDISRYSRIFISPDIDFTRIRPSNKLLRIFFYMANAIKIPAPALEYNTLGKVKFHLLLLN